tara:strand:+ start:403 stop:1233 length:831 start_codon:yes stop_codon:yes gene_type:complete
MSTLKVDDIQSRQSTDDAISLASDSSVSLKHSASAKLTTTATGVTVSGTCTADTFSGSGASLTSLPAANLTGTLPALSAANLTSIPAANLTGTLPALSAANLTSIPAANITGALPAIDGSALTNLPTQHPAWFGAQDTEYNVSNQTWTTIYNLGNYAVNPSVNNGGWDESTGVFTVQSGQAGIYYAFGSAAIDDIQSDDIVLAAIQKNSENMSSYTVRGHVLHTYSGNDIAQAQIAQVFSLAVGDTLRLQVYHNEGSSEPTEAAYCHFGGFRIFAT